MKRVKIIMSYYQGHLISIICVSIVLVAILFVSLTAISDTTVYEQAYDLYNHENLNNSFYYVESGGVETSCSVPDISEIVKLRGVKDVVYIIYARMLDCNVFILPESFLDTFPLDVFSGSTLSELPNNNNSEGTINAVVCGEFFDEYSIGDKFVTRTDYNGKEIDFSICGKMKEGTVFPSFSRTGGRLATDSLYIIADITTRIVLIRECDLTEQLGIEPWFDGVGCIVRFEKNISSDEFDQCLSTLSARGRVISLEEVVKRGKENLTFFIKRNILFPSFGILLSMLGYISIFINVFSSKLKECRIFYLCGYNTKMAFIDMTMCIMLPILLSFCAIISLSVAIPRIAVAGYMEIPFISSTIAFKPSSYLLLLALFVVNILLSLLLSFLYVNKAFSNRDYRRKL